MPSAQHNIDLSWSQCGVVRLEFRVKNMQVGQDEGLGQCGLRARVPDSSDGKRSKS